MIRKPLPTALPEDVGLHSADILAYLDALEASDTEMHGLMILRHGKVCFKMSHIGSGINEPGVLIISHNIISRPQITVYK